MHKSFDFWLRMIVALDTADMTSSKERSGLLLSMWLAFFFKELHACSAVEKERKYHRSTLHRHSQSYNT